MTHKVPFMINNDKLSPATHLLLETPAHHNIVFWRRRRRRKWDAESGVEKEGKTVRRFVKVIHSYLRKWLSDAAFVILEKGWARTRFPIDKIFKPFNTISGCPEGGKKAFLKGDTWLSLEVFIVSPQNQKKKKNHSGEKIVGNYSPHLETDLQSFFPLLIN